MLDTVPMPDSLPKILSVMHDLYGKEVQTIRGGTQVSLQGCPYKSVAQLVRAIGERLDHHLQRPWSFAGAWTVRMTKGGHHIKHNHPEGDISGVYYVAVGDGADLIVDGEAIKPQREMLVLFPSTAPHETTAYQGDEPRMTVAFDVRYS
jgi:hypothetical protein